jgi:Ran GTPase-activating protein (RanGAP) involved in mRNA processing and transport
MLKDVVSYIPKTIKLLAFSDCCFKEKEEDKAKEETNNGAGNDKGIKQSTVIAETSDDSCIELLCDIMKRCSSLSYVVLKLPNLTDSQLETVTKNLEKYNELVSLNIEAKDIGSKSCDHIAKAIKNSSETLTCTAISCDKFTAADDKPFKKIMDVLKNIKNPKYVGISINNAKEEEISHLFGGVKDLNKNLPKSEDTESEISANAGLQLKLFVGNIRSNDQVKLFRQAEKLSESIKSLKNLEGLDISGMGLNEKAMLAIINGMENVKELQVLNLSGNIIDSDCADKLAIILKATKLQALSMNRCFKGEESDEKASTDGGNLITKILSGTPEVQYLYLNNNGLKGSIKSIQIKSTPKLRLIDLSSNSCTTSDDISSLIEQASTHSELQIVNLSNNLKQTNEENAKIREKINIAFPKNIPIFLGV